MEGGPLSEFLNKVDSFTKKPENYLSLQKDEAELIKLFTKDLYGFSKTKEFPSTSTEALSELVITDLDEEQIWQQIELQNNAVLNNVVSNVAQLLAKKDKLKFPLKETKKKEKGKKSLIKSTLETKEINDNSYSNNDIKTRKTNLKDKVKMKNNIAHKKEFQSSVLDDKFFKLHEMEEFLEKMEKPKKSDHSGVKDGESEDDDDDDDSDINYFIDDSSGSDDVENQPKYSDFFDDPYDEISEFKTKRKLDMDEECKKKKRVKFALANSDDDESDGAGDNSDDDGEDDDDDDDDDDNHDANGLSSDDEGLFDAVSDEKEVENLNEESEEDDGNPTDINDEPNRNEKKVTPSTFEARQERLKARIDKLEQNALKEKPWQMKGEITADCRPQNSLLEEYVEFDVATRPAPILTEKSTVRLEDIIKQRIKDKAWDDVVRKIKPVDVGKEYSKKLVLDQEKSKLSLAQIYEQEYLKQVEKKATEDIVDKPEIEPPEHQEIRGLLNNLFRKLDALSNFHFTPKQVSAEVKIVSNLPAIMMEEVVPVATSDATLLAPEEVKAPQKGELIGKSERTATDKKRERRKKKLAQRLKFKKLEETAREKLESANGKGLQGKKLSNKLLQKITKSSNVTSLEEKGGKYLKSSTAFFSKLQDQTTGKIKQKNLEMGKTKFSKKMKSRKLK